VINQHQARKSSNILAHKLNRKDIISSCNQISFIVSHLYGLSEYGVLRLGHLLYAHIRKAFPVSMPMKYYYFSLDWGITIMNADYDDTDDRNINLS